MFIAQLRSLSVLFYFVPQEISETSWLGFVQLTTSHTSSQTTSKTSLQTQTQTQTSWLAFVQLTA